jgi:hypothetical protein
MNIPVADLRPGDILIYVGVMRLVVNVKVMTGQWMNRITVSYLRSAECDSAEYIQHVYAEDCMMNPLIFVGVKS